MKNNKNVLIASISGIVVCIVCVCLLFLFASKSNSEMKGNETIPSQHEEISLGECYGDWVAGEWGGYVSGTCGQTSEPTSATSGETYVQCGYNESPGSSVCLQAIGSASGCHKSRTWTRSVVSCPASAPVIHCSNPTYNGQVQTIATCENGTITSGGTGRNVSDGYNVRCEGEGGIRTQMCYMAKATPTINSGFTDFTMIAGTVEGISTTADSGGTMTYSSSDSSVVEVSGSEARAKKPGTARITATVAETTNYKGGSKTITVTVEASGSQEIAVLTCYQKTFNGQSQVVAKCNDYCAITKFAGESHDTTEVSAKDVGTYAVEATAEASQNAKFANGRTDDSCTAEIKSSTTCIDGNNRGDCTDGMTLNRGDECTIPANTICRYNSGTYDHWAGYNLAWSCSNSAASTTISCSSTEQVIDKIQISSPASKLYLNESEYNGYGFQRVSYKAIDTNGQIINANNVTWTFISGSNVVDSKTTTASEFLVVYKGLGCNSTSVTAKVKATYNGKSVPSDGITIDPNHKRWSDPQTFDKVKPSNYILLTQTTTRYECDAVSGPYTDPTDGKLKYHYSHNRCCGGGGGSSSTPTPKPTATPVPTPTPTPKISRCYIDSDNNYHWTSNPESGWKIAKDENGNEITNKDLCPPKDACYIDSNGEYIWGEYSAKPGYTYVAEITDKDSCKKDETYACYRMDSEYSCYKKDSDYVLAKQAPEGYTKEDDKSKCGNEYIWSKEDKTGYEKTGLPYNKCENPACYYYEKDNKRVWGYYSKINGYYLLVDENDIPLPQDQCRNDMCYKDPDGDYVWGDHEDEEGFTPLPEITDISECGPEVPTPKTDINVSRVVYVVMAILMAAGIGFIYYSTIMKKDN